MVKPMVAWVCAPHQSSGHRRHDCGGELVLDEQVADLRAVAVREDDLVAGRDEVGDVLHGRRDGGALVVGRGAAVGGGHRVAAQGEENPH